MTHPNGASQVKSGLVKSGQDRSSKFGSNIKSGQVKSSWDRSNQVKFGLVKSDRSTISFTQNLFGPKMHLRMQFDSVVGPTCFYFEPFTISSFQFCQGQHKLQCDGNYQTIENKL